eukprot:5487882-Ditylum_brightwellii.AAC.1
MSGSLRSTRSIQGSVTKSLVGLSDNQVKKLEDEYGVTTLQELALLDKEDVNDLLGKEKPTFIVRRKLFRIANYLCIGGVLSSTTAMDDILSHNRGGTNAT